MQCMNNSSCTGLLFAVAVQIDSERRLMIIVNRSVDHPQIPPTKQYVRVETYLSEMVIRPHSSFDEVFPAHGALTTK